MADPINAIAGWQITGWLLFRKIYIIIIQFIQLSFKCSKTIITAANKEKPNREGRGAAGNRKKKRKNRGKNKKNKKTKKETEERNRD